MFPLNIVSIEILALILFVPVLIEGSNKTENRVGRRLIRQYEGSSVGVAGSPPQSVQYNAYPPGSASGSQFGGGGTGQLSQSYYQSPGATDVASMSSGIDGGYLPGPPPPQLSSSPIQQSYLPGPPYSSTYNSGYQPGPPPGLSAYIPENEYYTSQQQGQEPPQIYPGGSLGYQPSLSPYGTSNQYAPVIFPYAPASYSSSDYAPSSALSSGYLPGKPPYTTQYGYGPIQQSPYFGSSSASASASSGFGGAASAAATVSSPSQSFGWAPPPAPPPPIPPPPAQGPPEIGQLFGWGPPPQSPTPPPQAPQGPPETGQLFGWGPPPQSPTPPPQAPQGPPETGQLFGWGPPPQPPPPRPPPEFSYQFSLKPSSFGWETSYNVPCGNYQIQPRVIAHLRLATQAVLPKDSPTSKNEFPSNEENRRKRQSLLPPARSFIDPFRLERQLQSYNPYNPQPFTQPRPTFRPRTCRWNFNAADECKLKFQCDWFQLPALFRCDENYLRVTDNTILLDKTFCGNRRPREIYSSASGRLALTFKSEGAALPAILDCTVLCAAEDFISDLNSSSAPISEIATDAPVSSVQPVTNPPPPQVPFASYPIIAHQVTLVQSPPRESPSNREQRKNVTLIIKRQSTPSKPQLRTGNCKCGVPDSHYSSKFVHGRIVGGSPMLPGESPWTAALVKKNSNQPYCGASLINNKFLLTAAHCVLNQARKTRDSTNNSNVTFPSGNKTEQQQRIYFDVLLNEHDISQPNEIAGGTIRAKVDKVIVHPNYDNVTYNYDAALIRLAEPIEFNSWTERRVPLLQTYHLSRGSSSSSTSSGGSSINNTSSSISSGSEKRRESIKPDNTHRLFHNTFDFHSLKRRKRFLIPEIEARAIPPKPVPICLPDSDSPVERNGKTKKDPQDDYAVVTGWGLVAEGGTPSTELLKARVQIFNDSTCQDLYKKHNYVITGSMMCAGYINGRIDSCVGDSGSPLAIEDKDRSVLTGVVSWGRGCGRKQLPGVYTKVTELKDWIYEEASDDDVVWCE